MLNKIAHSFRSVASGVFTRARCITSRQELHLSVRSLLLFTLPALLVGQVERKDNVLQIPAMAAPPVIVQVPAGDKVSAIFLATKDVPSGTNVLSVVTSSKVRTILSTFNITAPGAYQMGTIPRGSIIMAYVTPPTGDLYRLASSPLLRGYRYEGDVLALHGNFVASQTLVYVGTSLLPLRPTAKRDHLELLLKTTGAETIITVYAGGLCDSVIIGPRQAARPK